MSEPVETTMSEREITALHAAARRLDAILGLSPRVLALQPLQGSVMDQAYKSDLHEQFHIAYALIVAAEDHLRTIFQILRTGPLPMYALYTLLRAAGEADVRCRHLLDLSTSPKERLGRALNERLDNLEEQSKFLPAKGSVLAARFGHLVKRAQANGVAPVYSRKNLRKLLGLGEARKSEVDLFATYFGGGSGAFRFLSGYVHSKPWIWLRRDRTVPTGEPGVRLAHIDLDGVLFASLLIAVVDLHEENLRNWSALAGRPQS